MSVQRGNYKKKGPKYKNTTAYKNDLYDKSPLTKALNNMIIAEVCGRCTDQIQWRIKYKKYKPLTQPKRCTKCLQKAVKKAYLVMCSKCAAENKVCAKCGEKAKIVNKATPSPSELASQQSKQKAELKLMSERERRAFHRNQTRPNQDEAEESDDDGKGGGEHQTLSSDDGKDHPTLTPEDGGNHSRPTISEAGGSAAPCIHGSLEAEFDKLTNLSECKESVEQPKEMI